MKIKQNEAVAVWGEKGAEGFSEDESTREREVPKLILKGAGAGNPAGRAGFPSGTPSRACSLPPVTRLRQVKASTLAGSRCFVRSHSTTMCSVSQSPSGP